MEQEPVSPDIQPKELPQSDDEPVIRGKFLHRFRTRRVAFGLAGSILFLLIVIFLLPIFKNKEDENPGSTENQIPQQNNNEESKAGEVKFTHQIFDPSKVSNIIPLGELNGGYVETQTINGVMINIKKDASGNADPIEVYAPTDMMLEDYAYFPDPFAPNRPTQWHLGFRISKDVKLSFDHLSSVSDEIKAVTPSTATSGYTPPLKKLSFKAGDLIATTSGTEQGHNWNIYLRDNRGNNTFVNQGRYEKVREGYDYVNAACPFDYYDDAQKNFYLALMGFSKAGQSKTCGTNSRDVKGSISGLWHLSKEGVKDDYQGQYATPFSIYLASSEEIILYEINRQRYIIGNKNATYKDPATVTDSHCYNLTEYGDSRSTKGYVFFRVVSGTEIKMNYNNTGTCPTQFPEAGSINYYR